MIRKPLRPLARILAARAQGGDPDLIEAAARAERIRAEEMPARRRAEPRLVLIACAFTLLFVTIGGRMGALATSGPQEPQERTASTKVFTERAEIRDRNGEILATNLATMSLYAHPHQMVDKEAAIRALLDIFGDLDEAQLRRKLAEGRKFAWIKRTISPEQQQLVHDLGEPGLLFGPREIRLYPNGKLAAHILGGAGFGVEDVNAAEIVGVAGVERTFDEFLRDPGQEGAPLRLSIDVTAQSVTRAVLEGGMRLMNAKGAAAVLMEAKTGRIVSMVSLPDFDPNLRPRPPVSGEPAASPLFNRAAQGVYELGSTFKIFAAALALEKGLATPDTMIETKGPMVWGKYRIRDFHNYGPKLSLTDVIVKSSNIGTAHLAIEAGTKAQQEFLGKLGLLEAPSLELPEARQAMPLLPPKWTELSTMTISYGHGIAATPLHLAAAYATVTNGGLKVTPTLRYDAAPPTEADRVISEKTSGQIREMLRQVVTRGTASLAEVPGYRVGGKTGTADKPKPGGGYYSDRVIATFAGVFPADDPEYVLVLSLDEPVDTTGEEPRRTAGWTAVPVSAELIRRVAPVLGLAPDTVTARLHARER